MFSCPCVRFIYVFDIPLMSTTKEKQWRLIHTKRQISSALRIAFVPVTIYFVNGISSWGQCLRKIRGQWFNWWYWLKWVQKNFSLIKWKSFFYPRNMKSWSWCLREKFIKKIASYILASSSFGVPVDTGENRNNRL